MDDLRYEELTGGNLLFKTLDQTAREKVIDLARAKTYTKGEVIIEQGAEGDEIFLLRMGMVDVQTMQEGFVVELNTLKPGTIFGEVAEVSGVRRTATVVAQADVEVLVFPGHELVEELRQHPTASKLLDHIVLHRAQDTISKTFGD